ncbi:hypothetical protein FHS83_003284 [Rhizomicrobium palustre]|uniref:Uncharacterized protein n=1 Tax=Rhizomicrobium palustre TaxID=189966 RepID=A0A846N2K5_9PROT|nr:hypothetical protein [Rhizomicrobium palustre]NIK89966.1 hypothetical protein [Rhizomicrobium palustre]
MSVDTQPSVTAPAQKKRFRWEWLVVAVVLIGVVAMEGLPTIAFIRNQRDRDHAVERISACRAKHGQATPRSLILYEMEAKGEKAWRQTAAELEKACEAQK